MWVGLRVRKKIFRLYRMALGEEGVGKGFCALRQQNAEVSSLSQKESKLKD